MKRLLTTILVLLFTGAFGSNVILDARWDRFNLDVIFAGTSVVRSSDNCESLVLIANRTTDGTTTETSIQYFINDICAYHIVASGFGIVPNGSFSMSQSQKSARLRTTAPAGSTGPLGAIDVTWSITDDEKLASSTTFEVLRGGELPGKLRGRSSSEEFSADVTASVVGFTMIGSGQFGWSSSRSRSE